MDACRGRKTLELYEKCRYRDERSGNAVEVMRGPLLSGGAALWVSENGAPARLMPEAEANRRFGGLLFGRPFDWRADPLVNVASELLRDLEAGSRVPIPAAPYY